MKRIAITQRVELISSYTERRDALDQNWITFLQSINLSPIIVPNNTHYVQELIEKESIEGVLLTGGNSLTRYGGNAPERDEVEKLLISFAYAKNLPLLGICRGMQMIQDFFGNSLYEISGHVATRHSLVIQEGHRLSSILNNYQDVNAFHKYGAFKVNGDLLQVAHSQDGVVMAVEHIEKKIFGVMWHSERESPYKEDDKALFKKIFGSGK